MKHFDLSNGPRSRDRSDVRQFNLLLTSDERTVIEQAVRRQGGSLSSFIRSVALRKAQDVISGRDDSEEFSFPFLPPWNPPILGVSGNLPYEHE
ncbi:type II toxin -antitoxin system TacA 1-like antitoxin [Paracoccus methylarcula]|uniref:DUF1778 domain-containing protein n=1 Tax=Paracoccus methylarcula TaxID=72022 RepID=A0A3R7LI68_9RHOB|nr:DUF1778 domain-containing protein [Paracoccus methylarcula]RNF32792.1 hypothetical protein A7A09_020235 [Paracoccus methylarcula]